MLIALIAFQTRLTFDQVIPCRFPAKTRVSIEQLLKLLPEQRPVSCVPRMAIGEVCGEPLSKTVCLPSGRTVPYFEMVCAYREIGPTCSEK